MEKKEFYQTMEVCDIHNRLRDTNDNFYYKWDDANLLFFIREGEDNQKNFISIKIFGKIPYNLITDFRKKYHSKHVIMTSLAVDEKYENISKEIDQFPFLFYKQKIKKEKLELEKRSDCDKYVSYVILSDKECLLRFILEMKDYLSKCRKEESDELSRYKELLIEIKARYKKQICIIHPDCWMQLDEKRRVYYNAVREKEKESDEYKKMRSLIFDFDNAILDIIKLDFYTLQKAGVSIDGLERDNSTDYGDGYIELNFPNSNSIYYRRDKWGVILKFSSDFFCFSHYYDLTTESFYFNIFEEEEEFDIAHKWAKTGNFESINEFLNVALERIQEVTDEYFDKKDNSFVFKKESRSF